MSKLSKYEKLLTQRALQFVPAALREVSEQDIRISLSEGRHEARMVEAAGRAALARYPAPVPRAEPMVAVLVTPLPVESEAIQRIPEKPQVVVKPPAAQSPVPVRVPPRSSRMPWPDDYFGVRPLEQRAAEATQ